MVKASGPIPMGAWAITASPEKSITVATPALVGVGAETVTA